MDVSIRILSSARNAESVRFSLSEQGSPSSVQARILAEVEAVRDVSAREVRPELEAVRELLRKRQVRHSDLINTGNGWNVISDCPELAEESFPLVRRERRLRLFAVFTLISAVLGLALWRLGSA